MAVVSDIEIRLRADIARLQQDMTAMRRTVDNGMRGITRAADLAKAAMAGVFAGLSIGAFAREVIQAQREFDKLNSSLVTATGSTQGAANAFEALQKFAATTPYSVAEATESFIKLRNLGLDPSEAALKSYGNTAAAMGKSLDQLIEAVADAATGEFERLKEFGIKAKQNGDRVSFTFQGTTKNIGNSSKEIQAYLKAIGDVNFNGAMEKRAATLDGAISNLGDTWDGFLRKVAQGGGGQVAAATVIALGNALNDLGAIFDVVAGKAEKESGAAKEASMVHKALTTAFEAAAVIGVNLAYILEQMGSDMGAFAASLAAFVKGDLKMSADIIEMRHKDAQEARKAVDAKSEAILGAAKKNQEAQEKEAQDLKNSGKDRLAQYGIQLTAEQQREQALANVADTMNRLNGTNAQAAGELRKLKEAYDTGGITLSQYNKFVSQINKETTTASTAYKDQAKNIDLANEAIKRNAQAKEYANKASQEQLDFLKRTGQMSEDDYIAQRADADVKALQDQKKELQNQMALLKGRYDTEKERAAFKTQIDAKDFEIEARRTKQDQDQFELEQKRQKEGLENYGDLLEAAQAETKTRQDALRDQQDEIDMLGMTGKQIAEVTAQRLRDQAAIMDQRAAVQDLTDATGQLGAETRKQADLLRGMADKTVDRQQLEDTRKFWGDVEQTAHDTFVSIADGGKNAFTRLKESAKNIFFEWLYQMTLKKWIVNIQANNSGLSSIMDIYKTGGFSGLFDAGKTILQGFSQNLSSTLGGAISKLGETFGSEAATSFGSSISSSASAGGIAAAVVAGMMANNKFYDQGWRIDGQVNDILKSQFSSMFKGNIFAPVIGVMTATMSSFEKIMKSIGVNGKLASMISGSAVFARAFGRKAPEIQSQGISGTISSAGFSGGAFANILEKGGWFRSDKRYTNTVALGAEQQSAFDSTIGGIMDSVRAFSQILGVSASTIDGYTKQVNVTLTKDDAENQKLIEAMFSGIGDELSQRVLPNIAQFQKAGETASEALQRVATDFAAVDGIMAQLGVDSQTAFRAVGVAAIEAKERLIDLAGGLENLVSQTSYFYDNFLTKAEQIAPVQKEVTDQLTLLGYAGIKTASQFKDVVMGVLNSSSVAFQGGAETYETLLALAPKFKQVNDYLIEIAKNGVDVAMGALGRAVDAQKDIVTKAYNDSMTLLQTRIDGVSDSIQRMTDLSQALKGAMTGVDAPGSAAASRQAADAQIATALAIAKASGVLPSADDLRDALSTLSNDSSDQFATLVDYQRAVARSNAQIAGLGDITDAQLSTAELQLKTLQDLQTQTEDAYDKEIARLDAMVTQAQNQLDALNGINNSVMSVNDAVRWVFQALTDLQTVQGSVPFVTPAAGTIPVVSTPTSSGTMESSPVVEEILNKVLEKLGHLNDTMAYGADASDRLARQFNDVSEGGNGLRTVPV